MPADVVVTDRLQALSELAADDLAALLGRAPHLLEGLTAPITRRKLAVSMSHDDHLLLSLQMCSPAAVQLAAVARAYGGTMTAGDVLREAAPLGDMGCRSVVDELAKQLITSSKAGTFVLRPGFDRFLRAPGRSLADAVQLGAVRAEALGDMIRAHGRRREVPARREERLDLVLRLIADATAVRNTIAAQSLELRSIFDHLLEVGVHGCRIDDFGVRPHQVAAFVRYAESSRPEPSVRALVVLKRLGLVHIDEYEGFVGLWREVVQSVRGRLLDTWPPVWSGSPVAVEPDEPRPPSSPGAMASLLRVIDAEPLPGLKSGGIGVKTYRSMAKRVGQSEQSVAIACSLGMALGLIEEHTQLVGRGRAAGLEYRYVASRAAVTEFAELPLAEQWRRMVTAWLSDTSGEAGPIEPALARQLLADLLAMPTDRAIAAADATAWISSRRALANYVPLDDVVEGLRFLDLIDSSGPLRLTCLGRTLLSEPERLAERFPTLAEHFVVQADHTVVAPPDLDPGVRGRLETIATLESEGSVRVYRLDSSRIAEALSTSDTTATLIEFLAEHSSVTLPASASQMVLDSERRRGGLTVAAATTVVTASDPIGLAAAVRVKPARLTMIAPTVAVSDLAPARVTAALRAKGLAPAVDARSGAVGIRVPDAPPGARRADASRRTAASTRPKVRPVLLAPEALRVLAGKIT